MALSDGHGSANRRFRIHNLDWSGEKPNTLFNASNVLRFFILVMSMYIAVTLGQLAHDGVLSNGHTGLYLMFVVTLVAAVYNIIILALMNIMAFSLGSLFFGFAGTVDALLLVFWAVCTYFAVQIDRPFAGQEGQGRADLIKGQLQRNKRHQITMAFCILNIIFFFACFCVSMKLQGHYREGNKLPIENSKMSLMMQRALSYSISKGDNDGMIAPRPLGLLRDEEMGAPMGISAPFNGGPVNRAPMVMNPGSKEVAGGGGGASPFMRGL